MKTNNSRYRNDAFTMQNLAEFVVALYFTFSMLHKVSVNAIACYDCRADDNPCNEGECHGATCIKMETSNIDNDRRTVYKSCSDEYEETQCKQSGFGSKLITRCACKSNFCNGDKNLVAAGLQSSAIRNNHTVVQFHSMPIYILLIFAMILNFLY